MRWKVLYAKKATAPSRAASARPPAAATFFPAAPVVDELEAAAFALTFLAPETALDPAAAAPLLAPEEAAEVAPLEAAEVVASPPFEE